MTLITGVLEQEADRDARKREAMYKVGSYVSERD